MGVEPADSNIDAGAAATLAEQLCDEWRAALLAKDRDRLAQIMHPAFRLVGVRGTAPLLVDRQQWLDALARMDLSELTLRIEGALRYGDTLIITATCAWKLRFLGQGIEEKVLVSDIWRLGDGAWRVVHRHSSLLPDAG